MKAIKLYIQKTLPESNISPDAPDPMDEVAWPIFRGDVAVWHVREGK